MTKDSNSTRKIAQHSVTGHPPQDLVPWITAKLGRFKKVFLIFFVAHAVRARGSDGHQIVCSRSTILKL